jgi:3-deoxy-7-phosphoheptulonate synthase
VLRYYAVDSALEALGGPASAHRHGLGRVPAAQQPSWEYHPDLARVREELATSAPLVDVHQIRDLRTRLARVEAGSGYLLHVGECAELFSMATPQHVERRAALYERMAKHLADRTGQEVVLIARIAGQHAKPRSEPFMMLPDGSLIPTYRGDAVNQLGEEVSVRAADPRRMLESYWRSRETVDYLQGKRVYLSHEALLRDYEEPMTRGDDVLYSGGAHLVWIGERTRNVWNWHVQWAALITNPVGVKLGPTVATRNVVDLVQALNPWRETGRLSLITRMGADLARDRLVAPIRAISYSRTPVVFQCDPMHGNTRKSGRSKVRFLTDIRGEISAFVQTLRAAGFHPGGLHLEVSPDDVTECHEDSSCVVGGDSAPPCDPRLNPEQAMAIVDHFATEVLG